MGDTSSGTAFREVALPAGCRIAQVFKNPNVPRSFLHCVDGRLFAAGFNAGGALCLGTSTDAPFTQVTLPAGKTLKAVTTGGSCTILHMTDGSLYGCGISDHGEVLFGSICGVGAHATVLLLDNGDMYGAVCLPPPLREECEGGVVGGDVLHWPNSSSLEYLQGSNSLGSLGLGSSTTSSTAFTKIALPTGRTATALACSYWNLVVILDDGSLATCGRGSDGILGDGTTADRYTLATVALPGTGRAASLRISIDTLLVRSTDGTISGTGGNFGGQLGLGHSDSPITVLTDIPIPGGATVDWFAAGSYETFIYTTEGRLLVAGMGGLELQFMTNTSDQLVLTESDLLTPQRGKLLGVAPYNSGTLAWGLAAPSLTGLSPTAAPWGSAARLTLTGTHFRTEEVATVVTVGGLPCANVVVVNASCLQCTTDPALTLGSHDIVVTNTDIGRNVTLANAFAVRCFRVAHLSATVGTAGDVITVTGCGFTAACRVQLGTGGDLLATTFLSATSLRFVVPAQPSAASITYEVLVTETATGEQSPPTGVPLFSYTWGDALWGTSFNAYNWMGDTSTGTAFREIALPEGCRIAQVFTNTAVSRSFLLCVDGRLFAAPTKTSAPASFFRDGPLEFSVNGVLRLESLGTLTSLSAFGGAIQLNAIYFRNAASTDAQPSPSLLHHLRSPAASSASMLLGANTPHLWQWTAAQWSRTTSASSLGWSTSRVDFRVIYWLGRNDDAGELCLGTTTNSPFTQVTMPAGKTLKTVVLGITSTILRMTDGLRCLCFCSVQYHATVLLLDNGAVYGAGSNENGRLGLGSSGTDVTAFTKIPLPAGRTATTIACTDTNLAAILDDGSVATCGQGVSGVNGDATTTDRYALGPAALPGTGRRAASLQISLVSLFVRSTDGIISGTGLNQFGQLGQNTATNVKVLTDIPIPGGATTVAWFATGSFTTFVYTTAGRLLMAGRDTDNQLFRTTPIDMLRVLTASDLFPQHGRLQGIAAGNAGTLAWGLAAPSLTCVSPTAAAVGSTARLTLTGTHFRAATAPVVVTVGGLPCTDLVVVNASCLQCTTDPALPLGSHAVTVTNTDIGLNATRANTFRIGCFRVANLSATVGAAGDVITVTGHGFTDTCKVQLGTGGDLLATTFLSARSLRFVVPAQPSAASITYEVLVTETATGEQSPPTGVPLFSYTWGDALWGTSFNAYNWMGDTSTGTAFREIALPEGCRIAQVFTNTAVSRSFLLCVDGRLFAAGRNDDAGELCLGTTTNSPFTQVTMPAGKTLKTVVLGITSTILRMTDGLRCGEGMEAFLGRTATTIACTDTNLAAILDDGSVATCGQGVSGVNGDATTTDRYALGRLPFRARGGGRPRSRFPWCRSSQLGQNTATNVKVLTDIPIPGGATTVAWFATGSFTTFVYTTAGRLLMAGRDTDNQLFRTTPIDMLRVLTASDLFPQHGRLQGIAAGNAGTLAWGLAAPSLTCVSPTAAAVGSTARLTLTGTHFRAATAPVVVTVGGLPCTDLVVVNASCLQCTTDPALPLGSHAVTVTNTDIGLNATRANTFRIGCFRVANLSATVGAAGDVITVTGHGFTDTCKVQLGTGGDLLATTFLSATSLRFVVPAQPSAASITYEVLVTETATGEQPDRGPLFSYTYCAAEGCIAQVFTNTAVSRSFLLCVDGRLFAAGRNDDAGELCLGTTTNSVHPGDHARGKTLKTVVITTILRMTDVRDSAGFASGHAAVARARAADRPDGRPMYQSGPDAPPLQAGTPPKSLGTSPKSSWYFTKITKGTNHTCHMTTLEDQVRYQTALVPSGEAPLNSPWSSSVSEAASTNQMYPKSTDSSTKKYHSPYQNQLGTFLASTKKSTRKVPGRVPEKYQGEYQKSTKGGYQEYQTTRYKNFLQYATVLLLDNGDVYGAGSNANGRLGLGSSVTSSGGFTKIPLPTGRTATKIACSYWNLAVIMDDGSLTTCGYGANGGNGDGTTNDRYVLGPAALPGTGRRAASLQISGAMLFVLSTDGRQLGLGHSSPITVLTDIPIPGGATVAWFAAGSYTTLFTPPMGASLRLVSLNSDGQLITTKTDNRLLVLTESDLLTPQDAELQGVYPYTYGTLAWGLAAPTLTGISPGIAFAGGSATLILTGTNFHPEAVVTVGGLPCTDLVVVNASCLQCTTDPALPLGSHAVTVTNTDIGLNATLTDAFTVVCFQVSSLNISAGRPDDVITVTGCGFTVTCKIHRLSLYGFCYALYRLSAQLGTGGPMLATTFLSATSLRFVVPAQPSAASITYEILVTETATGEQSPLTGVPLFSYAPTVSGLSVLHGPAGAITAVTVTGTNFASGAAVRLGTGVAHIDVTPSDESPVGSSLTFAMPTQASAESQLPAGGGASTTHSGQWAVAVVNPASAGSGLSAETGPGLTFSYEPVVTGVSPSRIARTASTNVTVTGRNLYSGATVSLTVGGGGSGTAPPGGHITPTSIAPGEDALTFILPAPASGVADLLEVHVSMLLGASGAVVYSPQTAVTIHFYTPPALVSVSAATSNAHSPLLAKVGDQVTVTFTANVALDTSPSALPAVILAGRGAAVAFACEATTFLAAVTMASGDTQGSLTYTLSMHELEGSPQTAATITGTLDVIFDSMVPRLTSVASTSSGAAGHVRVGDQAILTLQADEALDWATLPMVTLAGRIATVQLVGSATLRATVTLRASDLFGPIGYTLSGSLCDRAGNCNNSLAPASGSTGIIFGLVKQRPENGVTTVRAKPPNQRSRTNRVPQQIVFRARNLASYDHEPLIPHNHPQPQPPAADAFAARSNLTFSRQATAGAPQTVLIIASDPDGDSVPCTATCAGTAFALELSSVQAGLGAAGVPLEAVQWSCLGTDFLANYSAPLVAAPDYILWCVDLLGQRVPWGFVNVAPDLISAGHCNMIIPASTAGLTVGVPCTSTFIARDRWGNHVPCTNATANATFVLLLDGAAPANLTWTCTGGGDFAGTFTPMAPFGHTLKGATRASGEPVGEEATITVEPAPVDGALSTFSTNSTVIVAGHLLAVSIVARDAYGRSDVACTVTNDKTIFALLWDGCTPEDLSWDCTFIAAEGGEPVWLASFRPVVAGPHRLAVVALSDGAFLTSGGIQLPTLTVVEGPIAASQTTLTVVGGGSGPMAVGTPITLGLTARDAWRNPIGCTNDTASRLRVTVVGSSGDQVNVTWHCSGGGAFVSSAWTPARGDAGRTIALLCVFAGLAEPEVIASVNVTIADAPVADSTFTLSPSSPPAGSQVRVTIQARDPAGAQFGCTLETANTTFAVLLDGLALGGDGDAAMWACSEGDEIALFVAVVTVPCSAGGHTVAVTVGGRPIGGGAGTQTLAVTEAVVSAERSSFVAPASIRAGAAYTVTITARDGAGIVVPCTAATAAITFRLLWDGGAASVSVGLAVSWSCTGSSPAAAANFTATFAPTAAGSHAVVLTYGGRPLGAAAGGGSGAANVTVRPGAASAEHSRVAVEPSDVVVAGRPVRATFTGRDPYGNPVACAAATVGSTFAVGWGDGTGPAGAPPGLAWACNGSAFEATFSPTTSGPGLLEATLAGGGGGGAVGGGGGGSGGGHPIRVAPASPHASRSSFTTAATTTTTTPTAPPMAGVAFQVTITGRDPYGNAVPCTAESAAAAPFALLWDGRLVGPASSPAASWSCLTAEAATGAPSRYVGTFTPTAAGRHTLAATVGGMPLAGGSEGESGGTPTTTLVEVTIRPGPASAATSAVASSSLSASDGQLVAGRAGWVALAALDPYGNPVPCTEATANATFALALDGSPWEGATGVGWACSSSSDGQPTPLFVATFSCTVTHVGRHLVEVRLCGGSTLAGGRGQLDMTVTGPAVASHSTVRVSNTTVPAGSLVQVTFAARDAAGTLVGCTEDTANATFAVSWSWWSTGAGGGALAQADLVWSCSSDRPALFVVIICACTCIGGDADGHGTGQLSVRMAGSGEPLAAAPNVTMTLTPAVVSAARSSFVAPASIRAGAAYTVTITARDGAGIVVPCTAATAAITFRLLWDGGAASVSVGLAVSWSCTGSSPAAAANFTATFAPTAAGSHAVVLTYGGRPLGAAAGGGSGAANVTVRPGAVSAEHSRVAVEPSDVVVAGRPVRATFTGRDPYGNPVACAAATVDSTFAVGWGDGTGPAGAPPGLAWACNGSDFEATFSPTTSGPGLLEATLAGGGGGGAVGGGGGGSGGGHPIRVAPASPHASRSSFATTAATTTTTTPTAPPMAGVAFQVTITGRDPYGNAVPCTAESAAAAPFALLWDGRLVGPASSPAASWSCLTAEAATGAPSRFVGTFTPTAAGRHTLAATVGGMPLAGGSEGESGGTPTTTLVEVTIRPGPASAATSAVASSSLSASDGQLVAGRAGWVALAALDPYGNPIPCTEATANATFALALDGSPWEGATGGWACSSSSDGQPTPLFVATFSCTVTHVGRHLVEVRLCGGSALEGARGQLDMTVTEPESTDDLPPSIIIIQSILIHFVLVCAGPAVASHSTVRVSNTTVPAGSLVQVTFTARDAAGTAVGCTEATANATFAVSWSWWSSGGAGGGDLVWSCSSDRPALFVVIICACTCTGGEDEGHGTGQLSVRMAGSGEPLTAAPNVAMTLTPGPPSPPSRPSRSLAPLGPLPPPPHLFLLLFPSDGFCPTVWCSAVVSAARSSFVAPASIRAGAVFTVTITARDGAGIVVPCTAATAAITFRLLWDGGAASVSVGLAVSWSCTGSSPAAAANFTATFAPTAAGSHAVVLTYGGRPLGAAAGGGSGAANVTVRPAPPAPLSLSHCPTALARATVVPPGIRRSVSVVLTQNLLRAASAEHSRVAVEPSDVVVAGRPVRATFTGRDPYGNPVACAAATVGSTFAVGWGDGTGPAGAPPGLAWACNGSDFEATFSPTTSGPGLLEATLAGGGGGGAVGGGGGGSGGGHPIRVAPASPHASRSSFTTAATTTTTTPTAPPMAGVAFQVTITGRDPYGNAVPCTAESAAAAPFALLWDGRLVGPASSPAASWSCLTAEAATGAPSRFVGTFTPTAAGRHTLAATVGGMPLAGGSEGESGGTPTTTLVEVTIRPGPASAATSAVASSSLSASDGQLVAGRAGWVALAALDPYGNPVPCTEATANATFALALDGSPWEGATGVGWACSSSSDGQPTPLFVATFSCTVTHVGRHLVEVRLCGGSTLAGGRGQLDMTVTGPAAASHSTVRVSNTTVPAGSLVPVTVTARDAAGTVVGCTEATANATFAVSWSWWSSGGAGGGALAQADLVWSCSADRPALFVVIIFTCTCAGGGAVTGHLSVTMAGSGEPLMAASNVTMILTPAVVSAERSSFVAPANIPAGAVFTVTITARDVSGNLVPCTAATAAITFRLLWDGGAASVSVGLAVSWSCTGSSPAAAANFTATFAPTAAGSHAVVLTYGGRALGAAGSVSIGEAAANVTVSPGAVSAERSRVAVEPSDVVVAGRPVRATFTGRDPYGNPVACAAATVDSTFAVGWGDGTGPAGAPPGLVWACNGSDFAATFSPTTSGPGLLEARLAGGGGGAVGSGGGGGAGGHPIRVAPASPHASRSSFTTVVTTTPTAPTAPPMAGVAFQVTITGRDPYGNVVPCTAESAAAAPFELLWDGRLVGPASSPAASWSCLTAEAATGAPSRFVGTFTPTAAGRHTLAATVGGMPLAGGSEGESGGTPTTTLVEVTIRPGPASAATSAVASSSLSASDGQLVAGRAGWVALAALDPYGNPVPCTEATANATFALALDGSPWEGATGVGWACSSSTDGQPTPLFVATFSCTATHVGRHLVEVRLCGGSALAGARGQLDMIVTGPAAASHSTVRVSNTTVPAGSLVQATFTARDAAGTVVGCTEDTANATFAVRWSLWVGGDGGDGGELEVLAQADLVWSCSADRLGLFVVILCACTGGGAGTGQLSITMAGTGEPLASSPNVTIIFTAAVVSAERSSFVAPASIPAGAAYMVTIMARDGAGIVVPCTSLTAAITFRLLWDGGAASVSVGLAVSWSCTGSSPAAAANFTATFAPTAAGSHAVVLTYGGRPLGAAAGGGSIGEAAANVTVIPGPPFAARSSFTTLSPTVTAGATLHVIFTARDRYGNHVPCVAAAAAMARVPFAVFLDGFTPPGLAWLCTADAPARFHSIFVAPPEPGTHALTASCAGVGFTAGPSTITVLPDPSPTTIASGSVTFTSDNPNGPTRARLGDRLSLRFTASDPLGAATVLIIGHALAAAQLDQAATEWGASWVVRSSDCAEAGGVAASMWATVLNATDRAGNPLPSGTTPVAAPATVELDCIRPRLSRLTFTSSNALPRVAHPGDRLTVCFTATEPLLLITIGLTIAGHPVGVTTAAPTSFEASYQLTIADSLGPVGFTVLTLADLVGNTLEAPLSTPTEGPAVVYFGSNCTLDADCGTGGTCVSVAAGLFGCRCPPGSSGARCETVEGTCAVDGDCHNGGTCQGAAPSKACACPPAWTGDRCDTPVAEVYRCLADGDCQAGGDQGARCLAGMLTTTVGGSFVRLWECNCTHGYVLTTTPSGWTTCRPAVSATTVLWVVYVFSPLGSLLLIAVLVTLMLIKRRGKRRKTHPQQTNDDSKKKQELSVIVAVPAPVGFVVNPLGPSALTSAPPAASPPDPQPAGSFSLPEDLGGPSLPSDLFAPAVPPPPPPVPQEPVIIGAPDPGPVDAWINENLDSPSSPEPPSPVAPRPLSGGDHGRPPSSSSPSRSGQRASSSSSTRHTKEAGERAEAPSPAVLPPDIIDGLLGRLGLVIL
ncbi:hypothetical protein PAPYR_1734 [Paratrimastix pyriformis]|uniref:EGF-like domain-containing protein n=1 Tax=Paratrimastix pyriformis TaxID=342808 RepID=A0ABQ8UR58_9EUKA|nr:hypothetical protein PAPYR_1734 [Paratrimastix pyriformis]